ncbi:MAG: hypothetical protein MK086_12935, partial [Flavobacteriales bacterium]|nr:hypothetical protein [Flavobacteriales bacterium]
MNRKCLYRFWLSLGLTLLVGIEAPGQEVELKPLLQTDWALNNLKGKVKSVKVKIERNYDTETLPDAKQSEYDFDNYFVTKGLPIGYWKFDKLGFLEFTIARFKDKGWDHLAVEIRNNQGFKYAADETDYQKKKQWMGPYSFRHPVYNPYAVYLNYQSLYLSSNKKTREPHNRIYSYQFNPDSLITSEVFI